MNEVWDRGGGAWRGGVLIFVAAATPVIAYLGNQGFAPLVALGLSTRFGLVAVSAYLLSGVICTLLALRVTRALAARTRSSARPAGPPSRVTCFSPFCASAFAAWVMRRIGATAWSTTLMTSATLSATELLRNRLRLVDPEHQPRIVELQQLGWRPVKDPGQIA